jgi:hypothetical protein
VARASAASLNSQAGAEGVALQTTQIASIVKQLAPLMADSADAGAVSVAVLTNLINVLLPSTGVAVSQATVNAAIANAIALINAALPPGHAAVTAPTIVVLPPVTIPKG